MRESSSRSIQGRLTNCKTSLSGGEEAGDKQENRRTSTWEWQFHAVGITVPRHGTHSSTPWNSQSQRLELAVPKAGTHGPKGWNSEYQRLELRVPKAGTQSTKGWNAIWYSHVSKFQGCKRTDWSFKQTLHPESPERRWTRRYHPREKVQKKIRCPVGKSNGLI